MGSGVFGGATGGARQKQKSTPLSPILFADEEEATPAPRSRPTVVKEAADRRDAPRRDTTKPDAKQQAAGAACGGEEDEEVSTAWGAKERGGRLRRPATRREGSIPEVRADSSDEEDQTEDWHDAPANAPPAPFRTLEARPSSIHVLENRLNRQEDTLSHLRSNMNSMMLSLEAIATRVTGPAPTAPPPTTEPRSPPSPTPPPPSTEPSSPPSPPPTPPSTTPSSGQRTAVPPKVKGYNGLTDIETYLSQVEAVARGNGWSSADTARHVLAALEGDGREVIGDVKPTELDNFDEIVAALRRRFGRYAIQENARAQLKTRERGEEETVGKYAAVLIALTRRGWPDATETHREDILLRAFLDGLHPHRLREHVLLKRCKTMAAALEEANEADTVMSAPAPPPRAAAPPPPRAAATPSPRAATPRRPRVRAAALEEDSAEEEEECHEVAPKVCRRCLRIGHRPAECDAALPHDRPPCERCERVGHAAVDCRTPKNHLPQVRPPCARCERVGHSAVECRTQKNPQLPLNDQGKAK